MKKILFLLSLVVIACTSTIAQETPFIDGDVLVMLEKGESPEQILADFEMVNESFSEITLERNLSKLSNIYLFHIDHQHVDQYVMLEKIRKHPAVRAAQFNHLVEDRATTPNDPGFGNQWHHVDASDNDIDSDLAWDITTGGTTANGDDIVVCVIEGGGSNYNHTDLIANHWTNPNEIDANGIDDDGNGYTDDYNGWNAPNNNDNIPAGGHGTSVSGMIGAKGDNSNGGAGVNWDVKIMQVVVGGLSEANVIAAYAYPHDMRNLYNTTGGANGAFVVATNASWGIDGADPSNYPLWCAYYDDLGGVGILNCGATANNNVNIDVVGDMPTGCSSDYMISVTATNSSDVRTFSGYGATTIDLGAPGESVYLPSGSSGYGNTSGTSFASPCVAGAIGLMYSAPCTDIAALALTNPQVAADQMRAHLLNGVDGVPNLVGECVTGGRLNVRNSIDLLLLNCGPLPDCDPVDLTLSSDCFFNSGSGNVEAQITVDVTMSETFCTVQTVCYRTGAGPYTCDDLVTAGITFNNDNTYSIQGLLSNTLYEVYYTTTNGTSGTMTITTPDCSSEVPGCTDSSALNYDALATFDDGSCIYPCVNATLSIDTDCWGGEVSWEILDDGGNVIASVSGGTYGNSQNYTWSDCLIVGCYTFNIYDSFGDGLDGTASGCAIDGNYSMTDEFANVLFSMGVPNYGSGTSHAFCVSLAGISGCMDSNACNYDSTATTDDGSCEYVSCAGCMTTSACNYDASATIDDGSCEFTSCAGCMDPGACNYDLTATIDDGSCEYLSCAGCMTTTACNYDASATIDDGSCEFTSCAGCMDSGACNYDLTATIDDGSCEYLSCAGCMTTTACNYDASATIDDGSCEFTSCTGCMDSGACNYDLTATIDDGSCEFTSCAGCMDTSACNYDSTATIDDGSCEYTSCSCPSDFNNDGLVNVADLLLLLGDFGCTGSCMADLNGDGLTNAPDLLIFLGAFGNACP